MKRFPIKPEYCTLKRPSTDTIQRFAFVFPSRLNERYDWAIVMEQNGSKQSLFLFLSWLIENASFATVYDDTRVYALIIVVFLITTIRRNWRSRSATYHFASSITQNYANISEILQVRRGILKASAYDYIYISYSLRCF